MKLCFVVFSVFVFTSCFVEGVPSSSGATVTIALELPRGKTSLASTPLYIQACITAEDLAEPVCGSLEGPAPEEAEAYEETLSLQVVSGDRRSLSVTLFYATVDGVRSYSHYDPDLTLDPGDQTVTVEMTASPTFTLSAAFVGENVPLRCSAVDVLTGVVFPPADLVEDAFGNMVLILPDLPQGRFFYLVPEGQSELRFCPIFSGQDGNLQKTVNIDDESC